MRHFIAQRHARACPLAASRPARRGSIYQEDAVYGNEARQQPIANGGMVIICPNRERSPKNSAI